MHPPIRFPNLCYHFLEDSAYFAKLSWIFYLKRGVILRPIMRLSNHRRLYPISLISLFPLLQSLHFELPAYFEGLSSRIRLQHGTRSRPYPLQQDEHSRYPLQDACTSSHRSSLSSKQRDAAVLRNT